jgi:2'-5' RNA ligase
VNEPGTGARHTLRLFFALWPSAAERDALAIATGAAVAQVDGQAVPARNLHVTLAFLGSVPGRRFVDFVSIGGQCRFPRVWFQFDRLEYWAKPRVMVAMPAEIPAAGLEMVDWFWEKLTSLGLERESRPWRPHLTLVRKVRRPPPENLRLSPRRVVSTDPAAWALALVESTTHPSGARYKPLAEWALVG